MSIGRNIYEILPPVTDELTRQGIEYQVVGSIGLAPFLDPRWNLDGTDVYASADLYKSQYRREEQEEIGDADIQLLKPGTEDAAEAVLEASGISAATDLVVDFSPTYTLETLQPKQEHPFAVKSLIVGVADRYQIGSVVLRSALPFQVKLHPDALTTHTVHGNDFDMAVPPLGTLIGNYANRSIGGVRLRNSQNLNIAVERFLQKVPGAYEWLMDPDGPGRSQLRLAELFMGLRGSDPMVLGDPHDRMNHIVLSPVPRKELREAPEFMFREADSKLQTAVLRTARAKIAGVRAFEQSKAMDSIWSQHIMPHAGSLIHPNASKKS